MEPLELGYLIEWIKNKVLLIAILCESQMTCFFKKRKAQEFKGM